ncbi:MAG: hypothetical protein WAW73_07280 [Rhodoferax sp.]
MARWTETADDARRIARVVREMPLSGIVSVTLLNGTRIDGVLRKVSVGNNAGEGGWRYYGECEVETKDRKVFAIDFIDVELAIDAWNATTVAEYERLGLISIVK